MYSLLEVIQAVKADGRSRTTWCTGHPDREGGKKSLSVYRKRNGDIGLDCKSRRCSFSEILKAGGVSLSDLGRTDQASGRYSPSEKRLERKWEILDPDGHYIATHHRLDTEDGKSIWIIGEWGIVLRNKPSES